ncbi:hypothetical protein [Sulfuricystis thermophila]|uniref:hypothetical protein n=1 Tax=Sulfuricystis thermophila TaxID=2496847 RepID=UPI00103694ED|nr:hypothetical protein [Sulfuricystis thermophila]
MKSHIFARLSLLACLALFGAALQAAPPDTGFIDLTDDPPRELANISAGVPRGQELPENDPRVQQAREWLRQAATATQQSEEWIAANALKLARYIFTVQGVRATPLEVLEAYARLAAPGKSLSDISAAYFEARRKAPGRNHEAAMKALAP